jgi:outer membrane protein insertion porin family
VVPGDVFDTVKVRRSERIVSNLGYFSHVRSYPLSTDVLSEKDLVVEVEEQRTGQFMMGAGFSSVDKLVGFLEISQGNFDIYGWPYFTGAGQKLKLSAQFGSEKKSYELSFVEPWFMDRKLSAGFDLYRNDVSYTDYDIDRIGGAVNVGKSLPGANRMDFQYRLERVAVTDVADTNRYVYADSPEEEYYFDREEDTINSSVRLSLTHDTRNNPFFATSGTRVRLFGEMAGGPLGFDTDVYSVGVNVVQYIPLWFDHVLSVKARYDTVEEFDDTTEVPIGDRLFVGGGRTVRGFDYRDVGPKVITPGVDSLGNETVYHRPVGGKSRAMASIEYTVPVAKALRLGGFFDIGNAWRESYHLDTHSLASGAGVGLRLDIPGFPVRIDRAWVIEKDDELTDEDEWLVWIGYEY